MLVRLSLVSTRIMFVVCSLVMDVRESGVPCSVMLVRESLISCRVVLVLSTLLWNSGYYPGQDKHLHTLSNIWDFSNMKILTRTAPRLLFIMTTGNVSKPCPAL